MLLSNANDWVAKTGLLFSNFCALHLFVLILSCFHSPHTTSHQSYVSCHMCHVLPPVQNSTTWLHPDTR